MPTGCYSPTRSLLVMQPRRLTIQLEVTSGDLAAVQAREPWVRPSLVPQLSDEPAQSIPQFLPLEPRALLQNVEKRRTARAEGLEQFQRCFPHAQGGITQGLHENGTCPGMARVPGEKATGGHQAYAPIGILGVDRRLVQ